MNIDERLVAGIVNAVLSRMGDGADSSAERTAEAAAFLKAWTKRWKLPLPPRKST